LASDRTHRYRAIIIRSSFIAKSVHAFINRSDSPLRIGERLLARREERREDAWLTVDRWPSTINRHPIGSVAKVVAIEDDKLKKPV